VLDADLLGKPLHYTLELFIDQTLKVRSSRHTYD
jgi:hypothetical protein